MVAPAGAALGAGTVRGGWGAALAGICMPGMVWATAGKKAGSKTSSGNKTVDSFIRGAAAEIGRLWKGRQAVQHDAVLSG
ncbi:hypothetical protein GCM10011495_31000 [Hymenobacter frigidus]|uniref:Uncharacterized protein n=1 Tax=Hymenobacter frigidus TaxID=1524095 RepID=A0ABQ2AAG0_9BACT|nr:hypothetical protein GCM10011495_31000 [Hymenobacter frigidus]